ncbi:enoyl-CoA-hydratase DpgB [Kitasatospora cheerisanensis]|uniref:Enoyl-CoA hydratase n=1 Tax=Kitasatospora cheerisanensis KCTC 2395 TaxID=1348663 RepID=A0A066YP63_9ACTN|nr:enoyl-CoA-hydratase DpgB [Kitasatospora cheerisanensis]KDN81759.1 enoyl-CoA hydratase [Kitasatospora cheerisanensis KCTC 2395]
MPVNALVGGPVLRVDGSREISAELTHAVADLCDEAESTGADFAALYVSGAPPGDPGDAVEKRPDVAAVTKWERTVRRFERLRLPTLAAASGECGGVALDLLLTADVRVAAPDVRLRLAFQEHGTWPGMAAFRLVQQLGLAPARRMVLFGRPLTAREALERGLVDQLSTDPRRTLVAAARLLRRMSGPELAIRRQLAFDAQWMSFEDALGPHLAACDRALRAANGVTT